jgi:long-chain acyl-CoA synthetase
MLVQEFLERSADRAPEKVALVVDSKRITYSVFEAQSNQLANALIDRGINRGDRVVLYLHNSAELAIGIFGVLKAGGVFVVINPTTKPAKLGYILNNCQARCLITSGMNAAIQRHFPEPVPSILFQVVTSQEQEDPGIATVHLDEIFATCVTARPPQVNIDLDLASLIYTSGSTGEPKGVMSDHSNIDFATGSIIQYLHNTENDIVLNALPLSFDYGLYQLLMTVKFGGTLVLERGFVYPAAVLKRIEQEKVTGFPGVPTMFALLLQMDLSPYNLSSLRYVTNTAAALPVTHIIALRDLFPQARLYSMYGLTETKRTLYLPPEELDRRPGSVGIAIPGTEVWLEDEEGTRLGADRVGELVVRGRHVMRGYWNDPEMSSLRYRCGSIPGERLCYTGDLFIRDEEGFYTFIARKDDMIKCKGEKVSPVEVERVLYELPGVLEAAVIGIPDPILGQAIKAFIVARGKDVDEAAVMRHCRSKLEDFMVPKLIELRDELPKTISGKINKKELN